MPCTRFACLRPGLRQFPALVLAALLGLAPGPATTLRAAGGVTISPGSVTLAGGTSQSFSATVNGSSNPAVAWSVDGAANGSAAAGTIAAQTAQSVFLRQAYFTAGSKTLTIPVQAGDLIIVGWSVSNSPATTTCSDSAGNVYTALGTTPYSAPVEAMGYTFYAVARTAVSSLKVTITSAATASNGIFAQVVAGLSTIAASVLDASATHVDTANSNSHSTASLTTANAGDYLFTFWVQDYASTSVAEAGTGFVLASSDSAANATCARIVNAAGTYADTITTGKAVMMGSVIAAFKAATPGGTSSTATYVAPGGAGTHSVTATASSGSATAAVTVTAGLLSSTSITASNVNPPFGAGNITVTPVFPAGASAVVGTSQGASNISAAPVSGAAIPVQPGGFRTATSYWVRATDAAGNHADASVSVTPQTVTVGPVTPAGPTVSAGGGRTFSATATGGALGTLTWSATALGNAGAGTMNAGTGAWTAPATTGTVTIRATSTDDPTRSAATTATVVAAAAASISAATQTPLYGSTAVTVTPVFAAGETAVVGTALGGSDISAAPVSGTAIPVQPGGYVSNRTYYLRATNAAGDHADASIAIVPQTVVVGAVTPAAPTVTAGGALTFAVAGVTGGFLGTVAWSASAGTMNAVTGAWTAPAAAGAVTIRATSTDDPTRSASTSATVVLANTASIAASTQSPLYGATNVTVTPVFPAGDTATVGLTRGGSELSAAPASGTAIPVQPGGFIATVTCWVRATDASGSYVDASVLITPQTVAVGPVAPAAPTVSAGGSRTFAASATGGFLGTVNWSAIPLSNAGAGTMNAATGAWTAPAGTGTVTIRATSTDDPGRFSDTTATVVAAPTASLGASTGTPPYGSTAVTVTPGFGAGQTAVVGTSAGASDIAAAPVSGTAIPVQAGGFVAARTYFLRSTNAAGDHADASVAITPQTVSLAGISPSAPTVPAGGGQTFSTVVTGGFLDTVTWSAAALGNAGAGTMNAGTGAWTAPASTGTVTIRATSTDDPGKTAATTVTVVPAGGVSLTASSQNPLYGATNVTLTPVFPAGDSAVLGTTQGGSDLATAPVANTAFPVQAGGFTATATYWLRATDPANNVYDASVSVTPQTVAVGALSPAGTSAAPVPVGASATQQFTTAGVTGAVNTALVWSVNGVTGGSATVGTISATGLYTAPASPGICTVAAASQADPSRSATAIVAVQAIPASTTAVTLTPSTPAAVGSGGQLTFSAATVGSSTDTVTWSVDGIVGGNSAVGTIAGGVYTCPAVAAKAIHTITATSVGNPAMSASVRILAVVSNFQVNARTQFGAAGNGTTDDTAAIAAALAAAGNGICRVPAGTYLINPVANSGKFGLYIPSGTTLMLDPGASLQCKPQTGNRSGYSVIGMEENDCALVGGVIIGDRVARNLPTFINGKGTDYEAGIGVTIADGTGMFLLGVTSRNNCCDGFYLANKVSGVVLSDCVADNNRRQGCSPVSCSNVTLQYSTFSNTNGNDPACGIDLEPNSGSTVTNVQIIGCTVTGNLGGGIAGGGPTRYGPTGNGTAICRSCTVTGCTISGNGGSNYQLGGIYWDESSTITLSGNTIRDNLADGIMIYNYALNFTITGNTVTGNAGDGISLAYCTGTTVTGNTVTGNTGIAINNTDGTATVGSNVTN